MKNINVDNLVEFMLAGSEKELDQSVTDWIKEKIKIFKSEGICSNCRGHNCTPIISPRVVLKCDECGEYTEIAVDNINESVYNDVTVLHEDKLIEILRAKGAIQ